jgi:hypothetical protein
MFLNIRIAHLGVKLSFFTLKYNFNNNSNNNKIFNNINSGIFRPKFYNMMHDYPLTNLKILVQIWLNASCN